MNLELLRHLVDLEKESPRKIEIEYVGDSEVARLYMQRRQNITDDRVLVEIYTGGGQKGVIQGGISTAKEDLGLNQLADFKVGHSSGAAVIAYEQAGQSELGSTIFFEENVSNRFIQVGRPHRVMDLIGLERAFRLQKPLDVEALRNAKPVFYIGIGDRMAGRIDYFNLSTRPDPVADVISSCRVPVLSGIESILRRQIDGGMGRPRSIQFVLGNLNPTDVLIVSPVLLTVSNREQRKPFVNALRRSLRSLPNNQLLTTLIDYPEICEEQTNEVLSLIQGKTGIRAALIGAKSVPFSGAHMGREQLRMAFQNAREQTREIFLNI